MTEIEKDAARYRWLKEALQVAYDGEPVEHDGITVSCKMVFGRGEYRRIEAYINFADKRDEEIDLDSAIDRALPQAIPCLFELDEAGEATGTLMPFCSAGCREKVATTTHQKWSKGTSLVGDFGYTPHCEECGKEIG